MSALETAYGILGLSPGTSIETVRLRYKRLAMVWHPDRLHNNPAKDDAEAEMAKINGAKETIEAHFKGKLSKEACKSKANSNEEKQTDEQDQRRSRRWSEEDEAEEKRKAAAQAQSQAEWEAKLRESETKRWDISKKAGLVFLALFVFSLVITTVKSIFGLN